MYSNVLYRTMHTVMENNPEVRQTLPQNIEEYLPNSKYLNTLLVWVSVCLYPINVITAEPIGSQMFGTTEIYEYILRKL